jgi:hypothetical protein
MIDARYKKGYKCIQRYNSTNIIYRALIVTAEALLLNYIKTGAII